VSLFTPPLLSLLGFNRVLLPSSFEFRFTVPSTSAVHDDTSFAQMQHFVVAKVTGVSKGFFSRDLKCEEQAWVIATPILGENESESLRPPFLASCWHR
jgi:hypothetical protein